MSKSIGNVIAPADLVAEYGLDAVRYFLLRELPCGEDGDVSRSRLEERYAELANGLGNLVGRVAVMAEKYFAGAVDPVAFSSSDLDASLHQAMTSYDFRAYLDTVWSVVTAANEKIDREAPFKLVKTDPAAARATLSTLAAMIRWVGNVLEPIMPASAQEIGRRYQENHLLQGDSLFPRRDQK